MHYRLTKSRRGFTLIELILVVAILALLITALTLSLRGQRTKAEDTRAKSDLERLKLAFEEYYSDNNCYPPSEWFDNPEDCGTTHLTPYLKNIPCDRHTGLPYQLEKDASGCSWFKLYASLSHWEDPGVQALCATGGSTLGNYGVSSDNVVLSVACPSPSPIGSGHSSAPSSSPRPSDSNNYYCQEVNNCTDFDDSKFSCTPNWPEDPYCGSTGGPICPAAGSCTPL